MASESPGSWGGAVLEMIISVWQALVVPAGVGFFAFYKFRSSRQDSKATLADGSKREDRRDGMTYEQQLQAAVLAAVDSEKEGARWLIEEQKRILAQVEADKDEGWRERDRWQQIATHCYLQWRETVGELRQARTIAMAKSQRLQAANLMREDEKQVWSPIPIIPDLEAIVPKQKR